MATIVTEKCLFNIVRKLVLSNGEDDD